MKKRLRPGENYDVDVGSREDFERQMDRGAGIRPRTRDNP
jgi:hypothetical protein